ncbi:putative iron-dependent peroxidase [Mariprofundus aestuarium]|uniref:Putative iron-dependent peroxidase n=1 Tax=Mariprofundus aestuarium TaxID=1921086 RepID=A0A2K8L1A0_MARES|nr:Dyp-type peroxidase [Mariprofundus aestuarium]ATX78704.1 putative iron-dependent peroxidase [Mariprofundus aestuarium]
MDHSQSGILADVPMQARYLTFSIASESGLQTALYKLADFADGEQAVVGIGRPVTDSLGITVPGLTGFPVIEGAQVEIPSTQAALWCWLRSNDRGDLVHTGRKLIELLADAFTCDSIVDGFRYDIGRDLTGYEDGTENPTDDAAVKAALVSDAGVGLDGSSFVAVQQWVHDLDDFLTRPQEEQDDIIGRRKSDNEELADAPETAHVKRTAQEDFEPEAFVLRRSMPWADSSHEGLVFVAFGKNFDAFNALLKRMVGADDGIVDAMFSFTTPVNGSFYWCPPMRNGKLDLSALEL